MIIRMKNERIEVGIRLGMIGPNLELQRSVLGDLFDVMELRRGAFQRRQLRFQWSSRYGQIEILRMVGWVGRLFSEHFVDASV